MKYNILIYYILILLLFQISKSSVLLDENKLIKIQTNPKNYTLYSLKNISNPTKLNIQIFLCQKTNNTSHFSLLNGNNIIYETDIISSRQLTISITAQINLKLNITSLGLYFNYQYTNINKIIKSQGLIKSAYLISNDIEINLSPVLINYSTNYQLFSLNKNLTDQCEILEYTIKNKPIYNEILNQTLNNFILKEKIDK